MAAYLECPSIFLLMISMANRLEIPKSIEKRPLLGSGFIWHMILKHLKAMLKVCCFTRDRPLQFTPHDLWRGKPDPFFHQAVVNVNELPLFASDLCGSITSPHLSITKKTTKHHFCCKCHQKPGLRIGIGDHW